MSAHPVLTCLATITDALKADLAARFRDDREAYSKHNTAFIDALVLSLGGPARRIDWNP